MKRQKSWPFFLMALFFSLTSFFPVLHFSPYLAILFRCSGRIKALWISALCGFILDLLSTSPFGLHALKMLLVTIFLYRFRIYFIDKPIGLASYTTLISFVSTLISRLSLIFYDLALPLTFKGLMTDFILMPLTDALYALLFFSYPPIFYQFLRKNLLSLPFFDKKNS